MTRMGLGQHEAGHFELAASNYREALSFQPRSPEALNNLGLVLRELGRHGEAIEVLERARSVSLRSVEIQMNLGLALKEAGRFEESEASLRAALRIDPESSDVLVALGNLFRTGSEPEEARSYYEKAVAVAPESFDALNGLGIALRDVGDLEEATETLERSIAIDALRPEARNNLGNVFSALGMADEAFASFKSALALRPDDVETLTNLGNAWADAGRLDEAKRVFAEAIAIDPGHAMAHNRLAATYVAEGDLDAAAASVARALEQDPRLGDGHCTRGDLLRARGEHEAAVASYQDAVRFAPRHSHAYDGWGSPLFQLGRAGEAEAAFRESLRFDRRVAQVHHNLGLALQSQGRLDEAVESYENALKLKPDLPGTHSNLGNVMQERRDFDGAVASYERALEIQPDFFEALGNLGFARQYQGQLGEADRAYGRALEVRDDGGIQVRRALMLPVIMDSHADLMDARKRFEANLDGLMNDQVHLDDPLSQVGAANFYLAFHGLNDRQFQEKVARFYRDAAPSLSYEAPGLAGGRNSGKDGPIKVGFISRYLRNHTIGRFSEGLMRYLDRSRFEVTAIHTGARDPLADRIADSADNFLHLSGSLTQMQEAIGGLGLDVLIYPEIGMDPGTYFLSFARLAPVQCVMWGHPVTTGVDTIDYFLSSAVLEPDGADSHYSEQLVRLDGLPTYYLRPDLPDDLDKRNNLGFADHRIYASPQSLFKFHPDFDETLGEILRRDENGRVVLIEGISRNWTDLLRRRLAAAIPDVVDRVEFIKPQDGGDFLRLLASADALLDPTHFGGGNTSYEASAVGVPIVTQPGEFMRGRVTQALYARMGFDDCVASTSSDYVEMAFRLANDAEWRDDLRARIRAGRGEVFEDRQVVTEIGDFLESAVEAARDGERVTEWRSAA